MSGSEIIVILLLALVVLGPDKLPDAMRRAGKTVAELRRLGSSFQSEMRDTMDEPMREMRETANLLRGATDFRDTARKAVTGGMTATTTPAAATSTPAATTPAAATEPLATPTTPE
ncbi:MAG: twin-arginine translocase TatA/TatE family subunit, partial [Actinomycetota bacterium]|nr:twin-arginine translocase TatA/TatE family subunit [Actinomycetota bacterium]